MSPLIDKHRPANLALCRAYGIDVDLVMTSALRNRRFAQEAAKTRTVIFDASEIVEVA